jgi:hypothetical protein
MNLFILILFDVLNSVQAIFESVYTHVVNFPTGILESDTMINKDKDFQNS